jgi:hypothetical protein
MACLSQKVAFGAALAAMGASGVAAVPAAPTVILELAVWSAFLSAVAAEEAACMALIECLEDAGRHQDAETLRNELDELKREVEELKKLAPGIS